MSHKRSQSATHPEVEPPSSPEPVQPQCPLAQVEILHAGLRQALQQTRELLVALKRQKKQSRLVEATLASLRELKTAGM